MWGRNEIYSTLWLMVLVVQRLRDTCYIYWHCSCFWNYKPFRGMYRLYSIGHILYCDSFRLWHGTHALATETISHFVRFVGSNHGPPAEEKRTVLKLKDLRQTIYSNCTVQMRAKKTVLRFNNILNTTIIYQIKAFFVAPYFYICSV